MFAYRQGADDIDRTLTARIQFSLDIIKRSLGFCPIIGLFIEISERFDRSLKSPFRILNVSCARIRVVGPSAYLAKSTYQFQFGLDEV